VDAAPGRLPDDEQAGSRISLQDRPRAQRQLGLAQAARADARQQRGEAFLIRQLSAP